MRRFLFPFVLALLVFFPSAAFAATLSISPAGGTYTVGQRVIVNIAVSSDVSMNAASGVLSFPTDMLSVEYVNKGSVLNFWVTEPSYSNAAGRITFEGVSLSGFQGSNASVLTVAFRAKKSGSAQILFESGQVLANDGQGTDITSGLKGGSYVFAVGTAAPKPEPEPEPESVSTPVPPKVSSVLEAPVIRIGFKEGNEVVFGESDYSKADVVLSFVAVSGSKVFISGTADSEGRFELTVPTVLKNGAYAVTATMVLDDGRQTETSEPLSVQVGGVLSFLNWEYTTYFTLLLILALVILIGYLLKRGSFGKPNRFAPAVKKEVREAEDVLHRSFSLLRQDLSERMKAPSRKTPDGEKTDTLSLRKDLDDAERVISKEIHDIDSAAGKNK